MATAYNRIDLTWTDNSTDETAFQIERSTDGVNWSALISVAANTTSYPDTTVAPLTTYFYRVRAANANGSSAYTYGASATTPAPPAPPAAPSNCQAMATAYNRIDLTWTDNSTDETAFQIERSTDGVNFAPLASLGTNVTSYPDTTVVPLTTYFYRLRATNAI